VTQQSARDGVTTSASIGRGRTRCAGPRGADVEGDVSDRRADSVRPINGAPLAALAMGAAVLLDRGIAQINEHQHGQREGLT